MKKLKVMYISNSPHVGGGNKSLLRMALKIRSRGHDICIVVPDEGEFLEFIKENNIKFSILDHRLPSKYSKIHFLVKLIKYLKLVISYSPNIIHCNDLFCFNIVGVAGKLLRKPTICHMRFSVEKESVNYFMKTPPDIMIFNSYYLKNLFLSSNPNCFPDVEKKVIYNFFDPNEYYCPDSRLDLRKRWGIRDKFVVGMVGNIIPIKGHHIFVRMARELLKISESFRFLIVGKDLDPSNKNESELKKLVKTLDLGDYFLWLGFQKNVGEVLSAMDILVVPSIYEPFGRVAVEGLLAGLPVVASNTGGLKEILEKAPYGFLVEPENVTQFSAMVTKVFKDKKRYPVEENRNYAIEKFSEEINCSKLEEVYLKMLR